MKIVIDPEGDEDYEQTVITGVYQYAFCWSARKLDSSNGRRSVIADKNELLGMLKTMELDIKEHDNPPS